MYPDILQHPKGGVSIRLATVEVTSAYSPSPPDHTINCDCSSGDIPITLRADLRGQAYLVRKSDTGTTYAVTVSDAAGTVLGVLASPGETLFVQKNPTGTGWASVRSGANRALTVYGAGTAYALTGTAAAIDLGTTDPAKVLDRAGTYLLLATVQLAYAGATVAAETATLKLRRTNNTAGDVADSSVTIDLPVSTTLTHDYGVIHLPPVIYTTTNADDAIAIFGNVSVALSAGTITVKAGGTSLVAIRIA